MHPSRSQFFLPIQYENAKIFKRNNGGNLYD